MSSCKHCNTPIKNGNKFCNKSCAATYNNKGVRRHGQAPSKCLMCSKPTSGYQNIYCSNKCRGDHQSQLHEAKILSDENVGWKSIREYLIHTVGSCQCCGIKKWNDKPLSFECDHIDGDRSNNVLSNAKLLCPNCHSQTDTYRAKNVNNPKGKETRAKRYGAPGRTRTRIFNSSYD